MFVSGAWPGGLPGGGHRGEPGHRGADPAPRGLGVHTEDHTEPAQGGAPSQAR